MSDKHLINSLPYILGVVAAGTGVAIRTDPRASTAATNGKVIIFPPLPYKGQELAIYSLGYLIHEAGHIRATDFLATSPSTSTPLGRMLINILEDVRIERLITGAYPGARTWLDGLTRKFVETKRQGVTDPDAELSLIMVRYLQDWLYESVLGYSSLKGVGTRQRDLWRSKVTAEMADEIEKLALLAAWAPHTTQVVAAAGEIIAILQTEQQSSADQAQHTQQGNEGESGQPGDEDAPAQPSDGSGEADGDGQPGPNGAQGEESDRDDPNGQADSVEKQQDDGSQSPSANTSSGSPDEPTDDANAGGSSSGGQPSKDCPEHEPAADQVPHLGGADNKVPSEDGSNNDAQTPGASNGKAPKPDHGQSPCQTDPQAYADALNALLQTGEIAQGADRGDVIKEEMAAAVGVIASNKESTFTFPTVVPTLKAGGDAEMIERVKGASIALRYRMDEFLEASMKSRRRASDSGKRLVRDAARRLALGDVRLFEKRTEGQKIDTAVHVLLDISSSMLRENRYKVALDSSLALGVAMEDVDGVRFSMSAFPFHSNDVADVVLAGERVRDVAARAALMVPNGGTPLDKGLLHAHTALMTTKASRRVCLVVMDGEPDDIEAAKLLISMGEEDGIEYLGIGIGTAVNHITPNSCVVTDLDDLPKQVIAMMQDVILLPKAA